MRSTSAGTMLEQQPIPLIRRDGSWPGQVHIGVGWTAAPFLGWDLSERFDVVVLQYDNDRNLIDLVWRGHPLAAGVIHSAGLSSDSELSGQAGVLVDFETLPGAVRHLVVTLVAREVRRGLNVVRDTSCQVTDLASDQVLATKKYNRPGPDPAQLLGRFSRWIPSSDSPPWWAFVPLGRTCDATEVRSLNPIAMTYLP